MPAPSLPVVKPLAPLQVLAQARRLNESFSNFGYDDLARSFTLSRLGNELAEAMYVGGFGPWMDLDGDQVPSAPFELQLAAVGLLAATWTADIFLRKARDRNRLTMKQAWGRYRTLLGASLRLTEREVAMNRDLFAEQAWLDNLEAVQTKRVMEQVAHREPEGYV